MYGSSEVQKDLIPLSTLHMMTSSHSLFLPTMLESDEEPGRHQVKGTAHRKSKTDFKSCCSIADYNHVYFIVTEALVTLLLCMVKKCPTVCNISHFVILLGAYGATLKVSGKKKMKSKDFQSLSLLSFLLTIRFISQIKNCYSFSRNMKETKSVC